MSDDERREKVAGLSTAETMLLEQFVSRTKAMVSTLENIGSLLETADPEKLIDRFLDPKMRELMMSTLPGIEAATHALQGVEMITLLLSTLSKDEAHFAEVTPTAKEKHEGGAISEKDAADLKAMLSEPSVEPRRFTAGTDGTVEEEA